MEKRRKYNITEAKCAIQIPLKNCTMSVRGNVGGRSAGLYRTARKFSFTAQPHLTDGLFVLIHYILGNFKMDVQSF